jgi:hypothetical protein
MWISIGRFLKLRTLTKNSRFHVLTFENRNPSKTLRFYQNRFL